MKMLCFCWRRDDKGNILDLDKNKNKSILDLPVQRASYTYAASQGRTWACTEPLHFHFIFVFVFLFFRENQVEAEVSAPADVLLQVQRLFPGDHSGIIFATIIRI